MSLIKAIEKGNLAKVQELIANGADVNQIDRQSDQTPLQHAADAGQTEIVRALLEAGALLDSGYRASIEDATWNGHREIVALITQFHPYREACHDQYLKAMMVATIIGNLEIVQILLNAGLDINAIVGETGTALHYAIDRGQIAIAQFLIAQGADVNRQNTSEEAYDRQNSTPLLVLCEPHNPIAASNSLDLIFRQLLAAGADVNLANMTGKTPLLAMAESDREDFPRQLIAAGANLNAIDAEGRTALMIAADNGSSAMVQVLIQAGADLNAIDHQNCTALMYAEKDDPDALKEPSETDDEDNFFCKSQRFHDGIERRKAIRRQRIAKYLRDAGASEQGLTGLALVRAATNGKLGEVEAWIDAGADVNTIAPNEGTALMQAVRHHHLEIVETLLAEGADPNLKVYSTPLMEAAEAGQLEIVQHLLDAGADPNLTDSDREDWEGYTALDRAQRKGHTEIVQLLRQVSGSRQRRIPVSEWRGLVSDNLNDRMVLVQAPIESVARALSEIRSATVWQQNAFEQEVELTDLCFIVFQFSGHSWTVVHDKNVRSWGSGIGKEDAIALSRQLQTKAIDYGVSDTAGAIRYELFESGASIELFDACCDYDFLDEENEQEPGMIYGRSFKFRSSLRQIEIESVTQDFDFVDAFFKSQDAYVPAWGGGLHICGAGKRFTLSVTGLDPDDLRMDYVAS